MQRSSALMSHVTKSNIKGKSSVAHGRLQSTHGIARTACAGVGRGRSHHSGGSGTWWFGRGAPWAVAPCPLPEALRRYLHPAGQAAEGHMVATF